MASPLDGLPTIQDTFLHGAVTNAALAAYDNPPVQPPSQAGKGFFGAALGSGLRSLASQTASGVGAAARAVGATGVAGAVDDFAQQQKEAAAAADNTDYSSLPWYSPTGLAYRTLQGLPTMGAAALGAAGAAALGPAEAAGAALTAGGLALRGAGAAAALYPSSVGQNVQRAEDEGQPRQDGKALLLGVPEAIGQGALAATGEGALAKGLGKSALVDRLGKTIGETGAKVATGAVAGATAQAAAGASGEALMQMMGDPNRDFAQRSQAIINAALSGAAQGGVLGGAIHGLAKAPAEDVTNEDLEGATDIAIPGRTPAAVPGKMNPNQPAPQVNNAILAGETAGVMPVLRTPITEAQQNGPMQPQVATGDLSQGRAGVPKYMGMPVDVQQPPIPVGTDPAFSGLPRTPEQGPRPLPNIPVQMPEGGARAGVPINTDPEFVSATPPNLLAGVPDQVARANVPRALPVDNTRRGDRANANIPQATLALPPPEERVNRPRSGEVIPLGRPNPQSANIPKAPIAENIQPGRSGVPRAPIAENIQGPESANVPPYRPGDNTKPGDRNKAGVPRAPIAENLRPQTAGGAPAFNEPRPLGSQSAIPLGQVLRGEDVPPPGAPPRLPPPETPTAANERVPRPQSGESVVTPPPLGDLSQATGADLLTHMESNLHHPDGTTGQALMEEVQRRMEEAGVQPKSADDVREVLLQQDRDAATARTATTNADIIKSSVNAQAIRLPAFLKDPKLLGDTDALKAAIYKRASEQKTPLLPKQQIYKAARAFGILDENENLVDPRPKVEPEPETPDVSALPEGEPIANEVPTRPTLSADAPKAVKMHWGIAEKLMSNMPASLQADLGPELTRAQGLLAKNERGDMGSARGIIAKVKKAVEGQQAVDEAKGVETSTDAPTPDDNPDLAKKFTKKQASLKAQMSNAKTDEERQAARVALQKAGAEAGAPAPEAPAAPADPKVLDPRVVEPFASRPPDDHDRAITEKVAAGATGRDLLKHIVENGSSSVRKSIAARLLQSKVDAPVRFGTQEEAQADHPTLRNVYGDYNRGTGEVRLFDQSDLEHTVLEEMSHAATVDGINKNPEFKSQIQSVMDAAKKSMTPDERAHPSMSSPEEFVAATGNPDFEKTLRGMKPDGSKVTLWDRFKSVVAKFLGFPKGSETMFDHVMHLGGEAMDLTDAARPEYVGSAPDVTKTATLYARTVQDNADRLKRLADQPAGIKALGTTVYERLLKWRKEDDIAVSERNSVPTYPEYIQHKRDMGNANDALNGPVLQASMAADAKPQKVKDLYNKLMAATVGDVDYRKPFEKATWFKNAPAGLKAIKAEETRAANNIYNELKRKGDHQALDDLVAVNRMHRHVEIAVSAKNVMELPAFADHIKLAHDPMWTYQEKIDGTHSNPRAAADYWEDQANRMQNLAQKYIGNIRNAMAQETSPEQYASMEKAGASKEDLKTAKESVERYNVMKSNHDVMSSLERDMTRKIVALNEAPNFATRRKGGWFVASKFKDGFTPADVGKMQDVLRKSGFGDAVMQPGSDQRRIYIRVEHQQQADALHALMIGQHGITLDPKETSMGTAEQLIHAPGLTSAWVSALMEDFKRKFPITTDTGPAADELRSYQAQQHAQMAQHFLDMQPESSLSKLYAKRDDVHGFQADMLDSSNQRLLNSSRAMAGMAYNNKIADAQRRMREDVRNLNKAGPEVSSSARATAAAAVNESMIRAAQRPLAQPHSIFDWAREATHIMELGLSPIYTAKLAAQIYTNAIPQLAKTHGYANTTMAVMRNMPKALAILKATYAGLDKNHFVMSPEKLKGFPPELRDLLLTQQNRGTFNAGARTTAMYEGVHMHNKIHRMIHDYSGATTLYSEMYPRVVTALAAHDLYKGRPDTPTADYNDIHSFIQHKVNAANFDWNTMFSARATGKHGVFGAASPILSQLQGYHMRLIEMMTRHISDLAGTRGPEEQKAARRFLLGHMAAVAAVGGTMGLPAANMLAGVYDRFKDWETGDDTHDIKASYRQYLSDTFGNDMGEALSHGVPRLAGLDLSGVGEEGVVPFTDLVASKQKWEDALADWAKNSLGPAAKIASNTVLAARDIHNGDILEAATKFGPELTIRAAEAYKLNEYGYTDKSGFKFGADPTGGEVLQKLMGFTPPAEANYDEKSRTVEGLNERETYDKGNLLSHLAKAFNRHDPEEYAIWERKAIAYQRSHPGEPPPMAELSTYLAEHGRAAAVAGMTGLPLNTNLRDLNARGAVSYGNRNQ